MARVELRDVRKSYGAVDVIKGIDLDVAHGEFCVFVGPSGCGKSTLLRMISGLEPITGGDIVIGGEVVNKIPAADRGLAMVFQSYALYPHMSVRQNLSFGLENINRPKGRDRRQGRRGGEDAQDRHAAGPPAQGPVGRPASARRHRPRRGARAARVPLR